jgi:hypothetical protein
MSHSDNLQNAFANGFQGGWNSNPGQAWGAGPQAAQYGQFGWYNNNGLGQSAFGYGPNFGGGQGWGQIFGGQYGGQGQQRQLSHQDVGEVVRQLLPILPQVIAQAQQPQAAFGQGGGYGGNFSAAYGSSGRNLSQQDVNEVVRQILPVIPQIVGLLQQQGQQGHQGYANAVFGGNQGQGWNNQGQHNQGGYGFGNQNPSQHSLFGQNQSNGFGPFGQAAFGGNQGGYGQRQLNQAEVGEIVRQLTAALPQVIANLQAINQQPHAQQRAA